MNTQQVNKYSKEEKFWNELSLQELKKVSQIQQEDVFDFSILRSKGLGK